MKLPVGTVIFEGITGSGKSTQLDLFKRSDFGARYDYADCTSPIYDQLKDVRSYLTSMKQPLMPETLLHQFTNWMKIYEQKGKSDYLVVDRFVLSNLVYFLARSEAGNVSVDIGRVRDYFLQPFGVSVLEDSLTLYFDCPVSVARERSLGRVHRCHFDFELQKRASDIYLRELELYPYKVKIINGAGSKESIVERVLEALR